MFQLSRGKSHWWRHEAKARWNPPDPNKKFDEYSMHKVEIFRNYSEIILISIYMDKNCDTCLLDLPTLEENLWTLLRMRTIRKINFAGNISRKQK